MEGVKGVWVGGGGGVCRFIDLEKKGRARNTFHIIMVLAYVCFFNVSAKAFGYYRGRVNKHQLVLCDRGRDVWIDGFGTVVCMSLYSKSSPRLGIVPWPT